MADKIHKLVITTGSAQILKHILHLGEWYKGRSVALGLAAISVLEDLSSVQVAEDATEEQLQVTVTVEMTETEREACKICVKHFYDAGAFTLTKHIACLLMTLGLDG
mgnify:CR=1 FL=1